MLSVSDGDQVRVVVDVFMERLRVAGIGAKPQCAVVERDCWNARLVGRDHMAVLGIARPELVQHGGAKDVNVTELEVGGGNSGRIQEAARRIRTTVKSVSGAGPVELGKEAIA